MGMRDMYAFAIETCKGRMDGTAEERDGKLHFKGTVKSEEDKNKIWDAIKTISTWQKDVAVDIKVVAPEVKTYTVQAGDSLSKIAKEMLGNANAYMKIFEANKDQLSDPDKIKPGQVLKIPQ